MTKPEDLFRAEKERAVSSRNSQHARLLAEAKAAFDKLMAEGQAARKSGRPRKHPLPPLKTSSSRIPPKPPAPLAAAPTPVAVVQPKPEIKAVAKPAARPVATPDAKPNTKSAARARKPAKTRSAARAAKKSAKPKAKSAKRR
jgi:hypothetical protein